MSTDDNHPLSDQPAPFARRPVTWGRAPTTVFRAGPLPKGDRLPPLPEAPKSTPARASRAGILSGSMIPQAAPAPRPEPVSTPAPEPTTFAEAPTPPVRTRASTAGSDLSVRPLPSSDPAPEPRSGPRRDPAPVAASVEPAAMVSPGLASAAVRRRPSGRAPLYAGVAAVVIGAVAVGGWMLTRPPVAPAESAPAPALTDEASLPAAAPTPVIEAAPPVEAAPVSENENPAPSPVTPERAVATRPAPARTPSPSAATPAETLEPAPPPVSTAPTAPEIGILPAAPVGPPPTAAERPPSDPDAPIATRPQPLGTAAD